jgi:hypothetical protein
MTQRFAIQPASGTVAFGGAMKLLGQHEQPRPLKWRMLAEFRGGLLASLVIYATILIVYVIGAGLDGWRQGELGKAFAWATALQLAAASIIAAASSRWRRFGAGIAVISGLGLLLIIVFIALFFYALTHAKLTF